MTLNEYAKNTSQFLGRDVRLIFLGGVHRLSRKFNVSGMEQVQMIAANTMKEFMNNSDAEIRVVNADMIFDSVGSLTMENLTITGASILLDNTPKRSATIRGVKFMKSSLLQRYRLEVITPAPEDSEAPDEPPEGGPDEEGNVHYLNTTMGPHMHIYTRIEHSILEHSGGTGLQIVDERLHGDLKIDIKNTSISHHMQGGIIVESTTKLHFTIMDSVVEGNMVSGGKIIFSAAAGLGFTLIVLTVQELPYVALVSKTIEIFGACLWSCGCQEQQLWKLRTVNFLTILDRQSELPILRIVFV